MPLLLVFVDFIVAGIVVLDCARGVVVVVYWSDHRLAR
jgi:hypothetical protein